MARKRTPRYFSLKPSDRQWRRWLELSHGRADIWYRMRLVWDIDGKKWTSLRDAIDDDIRYYERAPIFSPHAAKKHLLEHSEIPVGTEFVLVNRRVGGKNILLVKGKSTVAITKGWRS